MVEEMIGDKVVVDLRSRFVCLGTLERVDDQFLSLKHADLHDLRDTETTRENYVARARMTGIHRNRKHLLVVRSEVIAISKLVDVVTG